MYIPVLPVCPRAKYDKQGHMLSRYWWIELIDQKQRQNDNNNNDNREEEENQSLPNPDIKIQRWLDRISNHERIQQSEGLREFIESEVGVGKLLFFLFLIFLTPTPAPTQPFIHPSPQ